MCMNKMLCGDMNYFLEPLSPDKNQNIQISPEEYKAYLEAKAQLIETILFEEKMQYVLSNYRDYEECLLKAALTDLMGEKKTYHEFQRERGEINRMVVNFLASARAYLDHGGHHLKKILKADAVPDFFPLTKANHYDSSFSYRMMEALRNYTQHRGFPVHMVSFKRSWVGESESEKNLEFTIAPKIRVEELIADRKFKKSVASELEDKGERLALTQMLRDYVERLSLIHDVTQKKTQESSQQALNMVSSALDRVKHEFGPDAVKPGIAVICRSEGAGSDNDASSSLIPEFAERYRVLTDANKPIKNLSKCYVSGKAEK